jgi:hypothetical protein
MDIERDSRVSIGLLGIECNLLAQQRTLTV